MTISSWRVGRLIRYTMAQQVAHVKSLITSQVPIIFEDVDGQKYAVFLLQWSRQITRLGVATRGSGSDVKVVYNLSIEQPSTGTYAGA